MRALPQQVISLIHYVELSNAGWWETTVDRCVLAALWLIKEPAPPSKIRKEVERQLDLGVKANEIEASLKRLVVNGEVHNLNDGRFKLSIETEKLLSERVAETNQLEKSVRGKFEQKIKAATPSQDPSKLWASFTDKFLVPLVTDTGARVYEFFFIAKGKENKWASHADAFLEEIPDDCRSAVSQAIIQFLDPGDPEVARFMLSYLDAYFVVTASGLSSKTASKLGELRKTPLDFTIFVDTNFVYSILGLHSNPLNETARDLMDLVKSVSTDVNVSFVISPITLKEAQQSIKRYRTQLGNASYSPNVAEAALDMQVSGIFSTFFERVRSSGRPISPTEYFAPYESNLVRILEEKGVKVFTDGQVEKYEKDPRVIADVGSQLSYEENKYKERAKSEYLITNDITLWHFVQDQRDKKITLPLQAKYWIVTVDYRFLIFDRYKTSPSARPPICMLPAQFIQVLRFFAPRSPEFEKMMLGSVRFPLVSREFDTKAERITLRILNQVARFEGIDDLSVETIEKVLTDDILRTHLTNNERISTLDEIKAVENSLARQLGEYEQSIVKKDEELTRLQSAVKNLVAQKETESEEKIELESQIKDLSERLAKQEHKQSKAKAVSGYTLLLAALLTPYPILLTLAWRYLLSNILYPWLAYVIGIALTLGVATAIARVAITQGGKDEHIAKTELFQKLSRNLRITAGIFGLASVAWSVISALMIEAIQRLVLP